MFLKIEDPSKAAKHVRWQHKRSGAPAVAEITISELEHPQTTQHRAGTVCRLTLFSDFLLHFLQLRRICVATNLQARR